MADQNQNPLLPSLDEDEQFVSSETFMNADTALDWDALVTRGNSNNSQHAMTKWERDSLYVKFDPLVASRKDTADRTSFIFKAPKPPGPIQRNVESLIPPDIIETPSTPSPPPSVVNDDGADVQKSKPGNVKGEFEVFSMTSNAPTSPKTLEKCESSSQNGVQSTPSPGKVQNSASQNVENFSASPNKLEKSQSQKVVESESPVRTGIIASPLQSDSNVQPLVESGMHSVSSPVQTMGRPPSPLQTSGTPPSPIQTIGRLLSQMQISETPPSPIQTIEGSPFPTQTAGYSLSPNQSTEKPQNAESSPSSLQAFASPPSSIIRDGNPSSQLTNLQPPLNGAKIVSPKKSDNATLVPNGQNSKSPCVNLRSPASSVLNNKNSPAVSEPQLIENRSTSPMDLKSSPSPQKLKKLSISPIKMDKDSPEDVENEQPRPKNVRRPVSKNTHIAPPHKTAEHSKPTTAENTNSNVPVLSKYKDCVSNYSSKEIQLNKNIEEFLKQKERHDKAIEQRDVAIEERNEAQKDLANVEARFAEMLALYEKVKAVTSMVEKNCIILQRREEILAEIIQKREERNQATHDMCTDVLEKMRRDFETRIREKEAENMKLKAKIRMCEMKTTKLEGEVAQVDRESESLRKLCEDLMKN